MSIFNEDFGSSMPSLSLTLNVEPLSKIPLGGEPPNLSSYDESKIISCRLLFTGLIY
jgi:hypothetical protein